MKYANFAWAAALIFTAPPAAAANLCNCCGVTTLESCSATCAPVKPPQGQCISAVDYDGSATIGKNSNPLYDLSLRSVWMGEPKRAELESFRLFLEAARKGAEKDRRSALRAYARRDIDKAAAEEFGKRYGNAIVNYFLGMESYHAASRSQ